MNRDELIETMGGWQDNLIWCPSQCYLPIKIKGNDYTLYLRWRGEDPWQGHVVVGNFDGSWSPDLFAIYHEQYSADEIDQAKEAIIRLANRWVKEGMKWIE